jgi:hypothetical protein
MFANSLMHLERSLDEQYRQKINLCELQLYLRGRNMINEIDDALERSLLGPSLLGFRV